MTRRERAIERAREAGIEAHEKSGGRHGDSPLRDAIDAAIRSVLEDVAGELIANQWGFISLDAAWEIRGQIDALIRELGDE